MESSPLVGAVEDLLGDAVELAGRRRPEAAGGPVQLVLDEDDYIAAVLALPAAGIVRDLASAEARRNGWQGRTLDAVALGFSGLGRALARGGAIDTAMCAREFARYLAGPPQPVEDWVALAAEIPAGRCAVAGGWEFGRFTEAQLWDVMPLPSVARSLDRRDPLRPDVWAQVAFLRRITDEEPPRPGAIYLNFGPDPNVIDLWEPLFALSLWSNHPTRVGARWLIEPGVAYQETTRPGLTFVPPGWPPIDDEVVLDMSDRLYSVEDSEWPWFATFQAALGRQLGDLPAGKARRRLEYAARHFLAATALGSGPGADVWQDESAPYPEQTLEALFRYCGALEAILGDGEGELTRKVSQRAAILTAATYSAALKLASDDDHGDPRVAVPPTFTDPLVIERIVRAAYNGRSKFGHGDEPDKDIWAKAPIPHLRAIVRAVLLARVILGWDGLGTNLSRTCDDALLSTRTRQDIQSRIDDFAASVEEAAST